MSAADPTPRTLRVVVVGMGSEYRRDDGAGPAVAELVTRGTGGITNLGPIADPLDLLGLWDDADLAIVIDAVRTGAAPGTVRSIELGAGPPARPEDPTPSAGPSTHGIGLAGVLRLARAVGRAPRRVVVVGIEGGDFGQGEGLTPEVARALPHAARHVTELLTTPIGAAR